VIAETTQNRSKFIFAAWEDLLQIRLIS